MQKEEVIACINNTGKIPANTPCPFSSECELNTFGGCMHKGTQHDVPFSCGAARGFVICRPTA